MMAERLLDMLNAPGAILPDLIVTDILTMVGADPQLIFTETLSCTLTDLNLKHTHTWIECRQGMMLLKGLTCPLSSVGACPCIHSWRLLACTPATPLLRCHLSRSRSAFLRGCPGSNARS
jgi:hypothetical protein